MAGILDFSTGEWVDTDRDGVVDAPPGSVIVQLGATLSYSAFVGLHSNGASRGGPIGYYPATVIGCLGDDLMYGGTSADVLMGEAGNDILTAKFGNDRLEGGAGDDTLHGSDSGDDDVLRGGDGNDTIYGALGNDSIEGGNDDDDITDSGGGAGQAAMLAIDAGAGNDTIIVTGGAPTGQVNGGSGSDAIGGSVSVDITQLALSNVETLLTPGVTKPLDAIIATRAELLAFDDIRSIDDQGIGTPNHVVRLHVVDGGVLDLTSAVADTAAMSITGSNFDDKIYGGLLNDSLAGGGGNDTLIGRLGNDTLAGGAGNDTYYVDSALDRVTELGGSGIDTVSSSVSFVLPAILAYGWVEKLVLTGSKPIDGTGNHTDNVIVGNKAANILIDTIGQDILRGNGGDDRLDGGYGSDTLVGGSGKDEFVFEAIPDLEPVSDTIADFSHRDDTILLGRDAFPILGNAGPLKRAFFRAGTAAQDASDHIIYDKSNGHLYFDGDGDDAGAMTLLLVLKNHAALTAGDIQLV